ncbi:DEAD/DEAH box helicase [Methylonatrum kenyense]|uniref:DEAD/DEAH box helicase n=1 Tax=Methylonatrum kenyense TaxID=455253 RepID=UPI0020BDC083|nr:DEAD/DEAH box helicase [Methylonatrum kenyense]MCK8516564.1 DEAD/DEAH box helicase [Methylonatrum kenyense]
MPANQSTDPIDGWFRRQGWQIQPFQRQVWQAYANGDSGLIHAPTGTSKTLAAWFRPVCEALQAEGAKHQNKEAPLTVLWITPLRALAADTTGHLQTTVEQLGLHWRVERRTGDTPQHIQRLRLALSDASLLDNLRQCLNAAEMARRHFREIARIAGLVFQGYPGQSKSTRPERLAPLGFLLSVSRIQSQLSSEDWQTRAQAMLERLKSRTPGRLRQQPARRNRRFGRPPARSGPPLSTSAADHAAATSSGGSAARCGSAAAVRNASVARGNDGGRPRSAAVARSAGHEVGVPNSNGNACGTNNDAEAGGNGAPSDNAASPRQPRSRRPACRPGSRLHDHQARRPDTPRGRRRQHRQPAPAH